ncbi:repressor [Enterococcus phage 53]|uniref:repressor n=1 Tax=Enterococcus phage 53 TaxID=3028143 RepID=UPI004034E09F|nr:repressor [Enterococcus phage 53]
MSEQKKVYAKLTEDEAVFACELGDKIKQIRESQELSRLELAKRAKVDHSTLILIEQGKRLPTLRIMMKLSKALHRELVISFTD